MSDPNQPDDRGRHDSRSGPDGHAYLRAWSWGDDRNHRPGIPWIGVFLVIFGGLLFVERALPQYEGLGDVALLAAGLASLAVWAIRRGTLALYAGAFLTALALPGTLEGLGIALGPGGGTLFFGLAFLFIAAVRAARGGGWGWQLLCGGILGLIGGSEVISRDVAGFVWPTLIVVIGLVLLLRGGRGT